MTTVLTWEPRRIRLNLTRTAACGILALLIATALQVVFLVAFLPAVLAHGTTAGADADWWRSLMFAVGRVSLLTSVAAMLAVALATLGRNTTFTLGVVFAWMAVVEGLIRGLRPEWGQYLWGENLATTLSWAQLRDAGFDRGPLLAAVTFVAYTSVIVGAATIIFWRRDIAGTS